MARSEASKFEGVRWRMTNAATCVENSDRTTRLIPGGANDGVKGESAAEGALPVGPVPANLPPMASPQRYQLQFSTVEEHVALLERAKALMARERPRVSLGELHLEAMKRFVASLEKRKFATRVSSAPRQRGDVSGASGRYIPAAFRREVYERDGGRCSYVDARRERCCETRYLEFHHLVPFAKGGAHRVSNLALRCAAHNRLAAEQDFGRELVATRSDAARHESLSRQWDNSNVDS